MKKLMFRIPLAERILFVLVVITALLNPLSSAIVLDWVNSVSIWASREAGSIVTVIFAAYLIGYIGWNIYKSNRVNIPAPKRTPRANRASRAQYIET